MRIAYLCNRFPAVSMTFVRREVAALRQLGVAVETFSIRRALPGDLLAPVDREAARTTYAVLPPKPLDLLGAHARALATRPLSYVRTLALSLRLGSGGARATLWRLFYFVEAIVVWNRCRRTGIRHLHAHFANVATDVALLCASFGDHPRSSRARDRWSWSFTLHGPVEFYDVYRAQLSQKIVRARFVICISDFARSQAMAFSEQSQWHKLHVVHCGVDPARWRPHDSCSHDEPASSDALHVLCVGRLISLKGQAVLIEALAQLRAEGRRLTATLVGDGVERDSLCELARREGVQELVEFAGSVGADRIREQFARADIFCLPSFAEGVPVVLMEAMAMELPVLSSRIMGIPELVRDGESGLLTAPGRVDQLAGALRCLADSAELRRRLGRAGRERVCAEYDIARSSERIAALLERYLSAPVVPASPGAPLSAPAESPSAGFPTSADLPLEPSSSREAVLPEGSRELSLALQNAGPPPGSDGKEV
jgi:colanic acid/amylovoran biosynthesis glycosyltransferase